MKVKELFEGESKVNINQGKVNEMIYSLVVDEYKNRKRQKVPAELISTIAREMRQSDVFWVHAFDDVTHEIEKALKAKSLEYGSAYEAIEHAVKDVSDAIDGYYKNPMNHAPGYKKPTVDLHIEPFLRDSSIAAALKKYLNVNLTESLNENNTFKQMAKENRERKKAAREAAEAAEKAHRAAASTAKKAKKVKDDVALHTKVIDAISMSFPDGDPIDHFMGYLNRNDLDMSDVNRVMKKYEKRDYYRYLSDMWDDVAKDAAHWANSRIEDGKDPEDSPYYTWKKGDKKVTLVQNPWK